MTFTYQSPVFFDEFDPNGHLHNTRFAVHVERAQTAYFDKLGMTGPDLHYVVRELHVEFLAPVDVPGDLPVTMTGIKIGNTSATYGFTCGLDPIRAQGYRVVVKVDPATGRPARWTDEYRQAFAGIAA
ncbi:acyl-CoA thioesterase [Actinoplanes sp. HUAS TT8]|uniref:acyl-CoA thioesterase n=1 Tax=Actinoplanes sp. HUAS TT8 TaxID=3447453 RepID=UPI003F527662